MFWKIFEVADQKLLDSGRCSVFDDVILHFILDFPVLSAQLLIDRAKYGKFSLGKSKACRSKIIASIEQPNDD